MKRKVSLNTQQIYHISNQAQAGRTLFESPADYIRMKLLLAYFQSDKRPMKFAHFINLCQPDLKRGSSYLKLFQQESYFKGNNFVEVIGYVILPNQIHLIIKQLKDGGISKFMANVQNSYARYLNYKTSSKGELWKSKFSNHCIEDMDELIHHLTYVHNAPVIEELVDDVGSWEESSFPEYDNQVNAPEIIPICTIDKVLLQSFESQGMLHMHKDAVRRIEMQHSCQKFSKMIHNLRIKQKNHKKETRNE